MKDVTIPRIMLAAGASGSGKTLITCGILQALLDRGLSPVSFKCGPDYIDPMFHTTVLGTKSVNLDTFFTDGETTRYLLARNASGAGLAVIEGVMGYYDGLGGTSEAASAYDVARVTDTPVVLIAGCRGMSLSVLAYIKGFLEYRRDSRISGVILNRISPSLYPALAARIRDELGVRVLGYVPEVRDFSLESRHLGLLLPDEISGIREKLSLLARTLEETLDLDAFLCLAKEAPPVDGREPERIRRVRDAARELLCSRTDSSTDFSTDTWTDTCTSTPADTSADSCTDTCSGRVPQKRSASADAPRRPVIAVARDEAFCFLYEDNLRLLRDLGAELVFFSPIRDGSLPKCDGLILCGGYPELHAGALSGNGEMLRSLGKAVREDGLPCLAECGGYMYLLQEMEDMDGQFWPMAGVLPGRAFRTPKLGRFGYVTLTPNSGAAGTLLSPSFRDEGVSDAGRDMDESHGKGEPDGGGSRDMDESRGGGDPDGGAGSDKDSSRGIDGRGSGILRGHEFHYYDTTDNGNAYHAVKPVGKRSWDCMHAAPTLTAGFPHLYYYANPRAALRFVEACARFRDRTERSRT